MMFHNGNGVVCTLLPSATLLALRSHSTASLIWVLILMVETMVCVCVLVCVLLRAWLCQANIMIFCIFFCHLLVAKTDTPMLSVMLPPSFEGSGFGPTYRMIGICCACARACAWDCILIVVFFCSVDMSDITQAVTVHAPGQSGMRWAVISCNALISAIFIFDIFLPSFLAHLGSKHYNDMQQLWTEGKLHPNFFAASVSEFKEKFAG